MAYFCNPKRGFKSYVDIEFKNQPNSKLIMRYLKNLKFPLLLSLVLLMTWACSNSDNADKANISVSLVDEPGDYENVFVEVLDVLVKYEGSEDDEADEDMDQDGDIDTDDNGWQSLGIINPGVYDLLELTGGISLQLVDNVEIETGVIKQIRLVLGENNSVVLEGESEARPLNTPSGQQSGLKIMVNQTIEAGFNYNFILDFDADASVVMAGSSENINLKPVLRASLEVNSGSLSGTVLPLDVAVEVTASNTEVTASTMTNDLGEFEILGLPTGVYTITITPDADSALTAVTIENVEITAGEITILETITLE